MLGGDLTAIDGAEAGAWIEADLSGESGTVSRYVPPVFDAYARLFHPAGDVAGNAVTWREVARRLGRTAHPEMQWHQIVGSSDPDNLVGTKWSGSNPRVGELEIKELDQLCRVLAEHTADCELCFFGLCVINGWVEDSLSGEERMKARLNLPWGRAHVVFSGPLSAVNEIGDVNPANKGSIGFVKAGAPPSNELALLDPGDPFWRKAPSLIWPSDRSWLVVSEVDFDSTLVGGTSALVEALVADPNLEAWEVEPNFSLTAFSDKINLLRDSGD